MLWTFSALPISFHAHSIVSPLRAYNQSLPRILLHSDRVCVIVRASEPSAHEQQSLEPRSTPYEQFNRASDIESHGVLKIAEKDISDYCSHLYGDDEAETSRCWTAYQYFEEQKKAAEEGCRIEIKDGVVSGVDCNRLDTFEEFIRQMLKQGRIKNTVKTLASLAGAEKRKSARSGGAGPITLGSLVEDLDANTSEDAPATHALRAVLAEIFNEHDYNKDGKMDVAEFRAAMRSLGDELSAKTVSTIYNSMGSTGWLSFDEFVSVVEAEEIRAHSRFAKGLRQMARNMQEPWWST